MNSEENALGFYDEDYLHFSAHTLGGERTENEVAFICQALSLKSGASVLDLGCGHGRISNGLARRGALVTAIEVLPIFLKRAREDAAREGLSVDYRQADIRQPVAAGPFDAAIMWFFSFGYHSDEDNLRVLRNIAQVLKPGGLLLLDQYNVSALARAADHHRVLDFGDSLLIQKPLYDLESGRWGAERIAVRDGVIRRSQFTCRSYSPVELSQMLREAGFRRPKLMGDGFQELNLDSTRLVALALKDHTT